MSELLAETGVPEAAPAAEPAAEVDPLAGGQVAGEATDAAEVAAPAAAEAPAFDPTELQARVEFLDERNAQLLDALREVVESGALGGAPGAAADPAAATLGQLVDEYGQVNPAALVQFIGAQQQATIAAIGQQLAPLVEALQGQQVEAAQAKGEDNLQGMLDDNVARHGEFASTPEADAEARGLVRTLAEQMFPEVASQFGANRRSAEIAMDRAAQQVRGLLRAAAGEAANQTMNRMATLAGAASDAGPGVAGVPGTPEFKSVGEVLAYHAPKLRESAG